MNITIDPFDKKSIDKAAKMISNYNTEFEAKARIFVERLAAIGATVASIRFSRAIYTGKNDVSVRVDSNGKTATICADGEAVGFIEFGSGKRYGSGHPMNGEFGTGPGTYPNGKGHWDDASGWWLPKEKGGTHTYGNPPAKAMVDARDTVVERINQIAREVWK